MSWLIYFVYSSLWRLIRLLPERTAYALFAKIASFAYRRNGKRVQRLRSNYKTVNPNLNSDQLEESVIKGLSNAMRYWCDTFRISDWDSKKISSTVKTHNEHFLFDPVAQGRGVIVALPHAGNWDHAGAYFCSKGVRVNTVAEHLKPERLFRRFLAHRERMGMRVLDLNAGVLYELEKTLNSGELVALVADRDLSRSGLNVNFFNATARMPAGPALLAYKTGADLITAFVAYNRDGIEIFLSDPLSVNRANEQKNEVARVTQLLANQFEKDISQHLESWHMQQRIFIDESFVERT
jgi:KDO2-lipid IV(A) lauroyltransferase